jgi:hypothetical protein
MNKKVLVFSLAVLTIFTAIGISSVDARGFSQNNLGFNSDQMTERRVQMIENNAELLGITVEQLENYHAEGKYMFEIAEELGLDVDNLREKIESNRQNRMKERLQDLVDDGKITQEQANERLESMQEFRGRGNFGGRPMKDRFTRGDCSLNN